MTLSGGSGAMCAGEPGEKLSCEMGGTHGTQLEKAGIWNPEVPRLPWP